MRKLLIAGGVGFVAGVYVLRRLGTHPFGPEERREQRAERRARRAIRAVDAALSAQEAALQSPRPLAHVKAARQEAELL